MARGKLLILVSVTLVIGFSASFVARPFIMPSSPTTIPHSLPPPMIAPAAPRSTQCFEANIVEARQVAAECRDGSIRGEECANAETAIITVESKERFKRFRAER